MERQEEWMRLLIDTAIAENSYWIYSDHRVTRIPEVESVIISGLLIRAVSILDASLEEYLTEKSMKVDSSNPKLYHRLKYLSDHGILMNYSDIDKWRVRRNDVGHEVNGVYTWSEYKDCLNSIYRELHNLSILKSFPNLEVKKTVERVSPTAEGVTIELSIQVVVFESEKIYSQFGWLKRA